MGREVFIPYLEQNAELTPEDEQLLSEIMSFENEWFVSFEQALLEQAKEEIDAFCRREYEQEEGADYSDLSSVKIAFTTTEDEMHEIQAVINFTKYRMETYIDDVLVDCVSYDSLASLVQDGLKYLDFDSLVSVTEEQLVPFYKGETPSPAEIQDNQELIGKEVMIDNRRYVIEGISEISGDVSMRDVTFQNQAGIPMNRVEKIGYIRSLFEQEVLPPEKENVDVSIPSDDRRNFRITDDALGMGGAKEKFRNNIAAIQTLHELEIENRLATLEEQEILSKYVGWGGLSQAFDENNAAWADEFAELYENLSPEEYRAAMEPTLTAFYTPPVVIKAMYEVLDRLGYEKGNILEKSTTRLIQRMTWNTPETA